MTSKERVLQTLDHKEPDRISIGEWGGVDHDIVEKVIEQDTYWRNRKAIELTGFETQKYIKENIYHAKENKDYYHRRRKCHLGSEPAQ